MGGCCVATKGSLEDHISLTFTTLGMNGLTITAMRVDGLEETKGDPNIHGKDVEVPREVAIEERSQNCACSQNHNLSGVGILCSETERCRVLVVDLVNVLVQDTGVEHLVGCGKRCQDFILARDKSTNQQSGTSPRRKRKTRLGEP